MEAPRCGGALWAMVSQLGSYIQEPIRICENTGENNSPNFKTDSRIE